VDDTCIIYIHCIDYCTFNIYIVIHFYDILFSVDANLYRLFTVFVLFFISISGLPLEIRLSSGEGRDAINWYFLLNQDLNFLHHVTRGLFVFHDLRWEVVGGVFDIAGMVHHHCLNFRFNNWFCSLPHVYSIYLFSFQVYAQKLRSLNPIYTIKAFVKNMVEVFDGKFAERKLCQSLSHLHDQNLCKVCFVRPHKFGSPSHHFSNSCALFTYDLDWNDVSIGQFPSKSVKGLSQSF
jgi:hypothetical protein